MKTEGHTHEEISPEIAAQRRIVKKLYTASGLCLAFMAIEVIGGLLAGSLAVLSDAAHLFADLASFGIAIIAAHLAQLPTTDQHTFGLKRSESLAALFSMACLAVVSIWLAYEAVRRIIHPENDVDGKLMSGIAAIGVVVNLILAWVLGEHHVHLPGFDHSHNHNHESGCNGHGQEHEHSHGHEHNHDHSSAVAAPTVHHDHDHSHDSESLLEIKNKYGSMEPIHTDELTPNGNSSQPQNANLQAAYLHVMGDLAQSVAVLISGVVIWFQPTWKIVDPLCTMLFCALVFYSTLGVLRSSVAVLLEEVPPNVEWKEVYAAISKVDGVSDVHDLHIWCISHGVPTLSVHCSAVDPHQALKDVYKVCQERGISHSTIQVQQFGNGAPCCVTCAPNIEGCDAMRISQHLSSASAQAIL